MIRDPSDGSNRSAKEINPDANEINTMTAKKLSKEITPSGLPTGSQKPSNIARLEKSRAWMKDYHARKAAE